MATSGRFSRTTDLVGVGAWLHAMERSLGSRIRALLDRKSARSTLPDLALESGKQSVNKFQNLSVHILSACLLAGPLFAEEGWTFFDNRKINKSAPQHLKQAILLGKGNAFFMGTPNVPAVIATCDNFREPTPRVIIDFEFYIHGQDGRVPVRYKFAQDRKWTHEKWINLDGSEELTLPFEYKDFRNSLLTGQDFTFEATSRNGKIYTAKFENAKIGASAVWSVLEWCPY